MNPYYNENELKKLFENCGLLEVYENEFHGVKRIDMSLVSKKVKNKSKLKKLEPSI